MPFAFFVLLGFPGKYGSYVSTYSNFVPQVFFILYGFFTLVPNEAKRRKKLKKALKRASKFFLIMFVVYLAINIFHLVYVDRGSNLFGTASAIKHALFNFFILNVWPFPIGGGIWFVQSLVYAYLFFLFAEKYGLNKFYVPILIALAVFTLATGEFAAFLGFPYRGYAYVPGGAVTRAIPYMLVGMLLRKHVDKLPKIPQWGYILLFPAGILVATAEIVLLRHMGKLVYVGHTIGFGLMAVALCCFTLAKQEAKTNFFSKHGRSYSRRLYALCQPVAYMCWIMVMVTKPELLPTVNQFSCVISFVLSFIAIWIFNLARTSFLHPEQDYLRKRKVKKSVRRLRRKVFRKHHKKATKHATEQTAEQVTEQTTDPATEQVTTEEDGSGTTPTAP